ncbi:uncharacterized protein AMSG_05042 [Thecamonas trahens ATCC 50062]|uniref:Uncharacterized protein n=1 Tax=Thecamonas trahens ATCC 50062 TaxID=461836 RepID=A0A0L0DA32_THETB|nr:hypothetical protein AMSG_05042 [Thecamonas trahens ATCC 50062]KNC49080.1 hypothetical protein AMSG_05042 [Thecamonas trahens ATCC 50062]|eukprot:XP_013758111.1 hypothetical protein AMSG_05042 [Thecamonas trahens ATCC 50062]
MDGEGDGEAAGRLKALLAPKAANPLKLSFHSRLPEARFDVVCMAYNSREQHVAVADTGVLALYGYTTRSGGWRGGAARRADPLAKPIATVPTDGRLEFLTYMPHVGNGVYVGVVNSSDVVVWNASLTRSSRLATHTSLSVMGFGWHPHRDELFAGFNMGLFCVWHLAVPHRHVRSAKLTSSDLGATLTPLVHTENETEWLGKLVLDHVHARVLGVEFSHLVVLSYDTGEVLFRFSKLHASTITALAFEPFAGVVFTVAADYAIHAWSIITGACHLKVTCTGHTHPVTHLAVASDALLLSTGDDGLIVLWDTSAGVELARFALAYPVGFEGYRDPPPPHARSWDPIRLRVPAVQLLFLPADVAPPPLGLGASVPTTPTSAGDRDRGASSAVLDRKSRCEGACVLARAGNQVASVLLHQSALPFLSIAAPVVSVQLTTMPAAGFSFAGETLVCDTTSTLHVFDTEFRNRRARYRYLDFSALSEAVRGKLTALKRDARAHAISEILADSSYTGATSSSQATIVKFEYLAAFDRFAFGYSDGTVELVRPSFEYSAFEDSDRILPLGTDSLLPLEETPVSPITTWQLVRVSADVCPQCSVMCAQIDVARAASRPMDYLEVASEQVAGSASLADLGIKKHVSPQARVRARVEAFVAEQVAADDANAAAAAAEANLRGRQPIDDVVADAFANLQSSTSLLAVERARAANEDSEFGALEPSIQADLLQRREVLINARRGGSAPDSADLDSTTLFDRYWRYRDDAEALHRKLFPPHTHPSPRILPWYVFAIAFGDGTFGVWCPHCGCKLRASPALASRLPICSMFVLPGRGPEPDSLICVATSAELLYAPLSAIASQPLRQVGVEVSDTPTSALMLTTAMVVSAVAVAPSHGFLLLGSTVGRVYPMALLRQPGSHETSPHKLYGAEQLTQLTGHTGAVTALDLCSRARHAVSSSDDGTLRVWDLDKLLCVHVLDLGMPITSVEYLNRSEDVLVAAEHEVLVLRASPHAACVELDAQIAIIDMASALESRIESMIGSPAVASVDPDDPTKLSIQLDGHQLAEMAYSYMDPQMDVDLLHAARHALRSGMRAKWRRARLRLLTVIRLWRRSSFIQRVLSKAENNPLVADDERKELRRLLRFHSAGNPSLMSMESSGEEPSLAELSSPSTSSSSLAPGGSAIDGYLSRVSRPPAAASADFVDRVLGAATAADEVGGADEASIAESTAAPSLRDLLAALP